MTTAFLVLNETTFFATDQVTTEAVSLWENLQGAMDAIHDIAVEHDVFVEDDASSVVIHSPSGTSIETDEYYIVEMELKPNG